MTKYFYNCKSIFMGKSFSKKLIKVGGQNPIEPAKCGCKIYHGPYVSNFKEIYNFLNQKEITLWWVTSMIYQLIYFKILK